MKALDRSPKKETEAEIHYLLGEIDYSQNAYKKAIVNFAKVQETFSKSDLIAPSLYKIALSFQKLGMKKEAEGFFSELKERFPKSKEAKKARAKFKD
jgi:TolA-binding protein